MEGYDVVYADGHDVVVTPSEFKVRDKHYRVLGIVRHGLAVIRPFRLVGMLVSLLGMGFILFGIVCIVVPPAMAATIDGVKVEAGHLCLWMGMLIVALGVILMGLIREFYAVRIATAKGEINAVVSRKREYIVRILNALSQACRLGNIRTSQLSRTVYL